nr:immunoglobulin light chain junction region [Macaca mulatta]
CLQSMNFPRTF